MKRFAVFVGLVVLFIGVRAQKSADFGIFGAANFEHQQTILPDPIIVSLKPAFGLFFRRNFNPRYALRVGGNYLLNPLNPSDVLHNLDVHVLGEFNFLPIEPKKEKPKVSTFVATGIAYYWPKVDVWPVAIPFTVGAKFRVTEQLGLTAEWNLRRVLGPSRDPILNTDRSNWHSFAGISAHYRIEEKCKDCPFYETKRKKKQ